MNEKYLLPIPILLVVLGILITSTTPQVPNNEPINVIDHDGTVQKGVIENGYLYEVSNNKKAQFQMNTKEYDSTHYKVNIYYIDSTSVEYSNIEKTE